MDRDQQRQEHDARRRAAAREGYIRWRMNDVPSIYYSLVPNSYDAAELWMAEKAIRAQLAADLELATSPWRQLGPVCNLLDTTKLSPVDNITFMLEAAIPIGMEDQPKAAHPAAAALYAQAAPQREEAMRRREQSRPAAAPPPAQPQQDQRQQDPKADDGPGDGPAAIGFCNAGLRRWSETFV